MVESYWSNLLRWKNLKGITFGVVASLILYFSIFNSSLFVPEGEETKFTLMFLGYAILGSYAFSRQRVNTLLSKVSFIKNIPLFLVFFFSTLLIFYFLLNIFNPFSSVFLSLLEGVPLYLQVINIAIFSTIETSFFSVFLQNKFGIIPSALFAGVMHAPVWTGTLIENFIGATILFLIFNSLYYIFSIKLRNKENPIPTIGIHSAYNFFMFG